MRIIFGAIISRHPFVPGSAWNRLQWVTGLQRLGHEVVYVEEIQPNWCLDEHGDLCEYQNSMNRRHFLRAMERFNLHGSSCQLYNGGESTAGIALETLLELVNGADLLINQSGHVRSDLVLDAVQRRVYVDQDPVYTQLWYSEYGKDLNFARHDAFCTVGLNIGTPHSPIPDGGIPWFHTLPPIVSEFWDHGLEDNAAADTPFTTIASLGGYGDLCFRGEWYGSKYDQFRDFAELPRRSNSRFELLFRDFQDDDENVAMLRANGWSVRRSSDVPQGNELSGYRDYIHRSRGEIGIAKGAYVKGRSGWFSDRTGCYLASGKPCLVQSTGFDRCLPVGAGLICFENLEQAAAGVDSINSNYRMHSRAAREWAAEHLDYRKVLPGMLHACMTPLTLSGGLL